MAENNIELKSVKELLGMKFFIPCYQRGYRWTEQQVKDLLNDLWEFAHKKNREYEFYCVQPLVVRQMSVEDKKSNNIAVDELWYEVIDGQQRLTTMYIILKKLKEALELLNLSTECYELKYQREPNEASIALFLENIANIHEECNSYIDFHYMSRSAIVIEEWLKSSGVNKGEFCNALLTYELDDNKPQRDKANNVRFIWYESVDENPIKVFTRLNIGKIPLTNAELIKALFLNSSNFDKYEANHLKLRQQEMASEWDNIEYTLQNDEFWLFLNEKGYNPQTRIDLIFKLICDQNKFGLEEKQLKEIGDDEYRTFRYFYELFKAKKKNIDEYWKCVKDYFRIFSEWYNDLEIYHYIGFLIACKEDSLETFVKQWEESSDKKSFERKLKERIQNIIDKCPALEAQYKEDGSDKRKCKPILLFHNIQTIINQNANNLKNDKYQMGVFFKFPFHLFKLEEWDVEHINSNTTNLEDDVDTQKEWLLNVYLGADDATQESIRKYFEADDEEKRKIFESVKKIFPEKNEWSLEEKNRIWNYTLLDSGTNRGYGNAIFSGKRRVVIGKDEGKLISIPEFDGNGKIQIGEEKIAKSSFVPLCTKHVFMKYYSTTMNDPNYWTKNDAEGYLNSLKECLNELRK